jgi:hypothetical protein
MTGGPLRRLQELAPGLRKGLALSLRATKEANLGVARQSAMDSVTSVRFQPSTIVRATVVRM